MLLAVLHVAPARQIYLSDFGLERESIQLMLLIVPLLLLNFDIFLLLMVQLSFIEVFERRLLAVTSLAKGVHATVWCK